METPLTGYGNSSYWLWKLPSLVVITPCTCTDNLLIHRFLNSFNIMIHPLLQMSMTLTDYNSALYLKDVQCFYGGLKLYIASGPN